MPELDLGALLELAKDDANCIYLDAQPESVIEECAERLLKVLSTIEYSEAFKSVQDRKD